MARFDAESRELNLKIVYHGPTLAGRTTNILYISSKTRPEARGTMMSCASEEEQWLRFDLRSLSMPPVDGHHIRLHLWCSPGARYIPLAKERVLDGADGLIFVADSDPFRSEANVEALSHLKTWLEGQGRPWATTPLVMTYNKRDLPQATPLAELQARLNREGRPEFETCAYTGIGVFDALRTSCNGILAHLRETGVIPSESRG
ncbi:MAG: GTPase domain-containing protein [Nannocystaceae bacterium]